MDGGPLKRGEREPGIREARSLGRCLVGEHGWKLHASAMVCRRKASWVQEKADVLYTCPFLFFRTLSFFKTWYALGGYVVTRLAVDVHPRVIQTGVGRGSPPLEKSSSQSVSSEWLKPARCNLGRSHSPCDSIFLTWESQAGRQPGRSALEDGNGKENRPQPQSE